MTIKLIRRMAIFALVGHEMLRGFDPVKNEPYRRCHAVWSGFNTAFREFFPREDPVRRMDELNRLGWIEKNIAHKGITFTPTAELLKPLNAEEQRFAAELRIFFAPYVERQRAKASKKFSASKPSKKSSKPNGHAEPAPEPLVASFGKKLPVQERADELWLSGDHMGAAALLGFTLTRS